MTTEPRAVSGPPEETRRIAGFGAIHVGPGGGDGRRTVSRTILLRTCRGRVNHRHDADMPALSRFINGECRHMGSVERAVMGIVGPLAGNTMPDGSGADARIAAVHAMDRMDDGIESSLDVPGRMPKRIRFGYSASDGPRGFVAALVAAMDSDPAIADMTCGAVAAAVRALGSIDDGDGRDMYRRWAYARLFSTVVIHTDPCMTAVRWPDGSMGMTPDHGLPSAARFRTSLVTGLAPHLDFPACHGIGDDDVTGVFDPVVALALRPLEEDGGSPVPFPCVAWATRPGTEDGRGAAHRIVAMAAAAGRVMGSRAVQDGIRARTGVWDSDGDDPGDGPLSPTSDTPLTWRALSCISKGVMPDPVMDAGASRLSSRMAIAEAMDTAACWTGDHRADPCRVLDLARAIGRPYGMGMSFVDDIHYGTTFIYGNGRHDDHGAGLAVDVITGAARHHDQEWVRALLSAWLLASLLHDGAGGDDDGPRPIAHLPSITDGDLAGAVRDLGDGAPGRFIAECLAAGNRDSYGKARSHVIIGDGMWDGRGFSIDIIGLDPRVRSDR